MAWTLRGPAGQRADVAELADAVDLGSIALTGCGGSSPLVGIFAAGGAIATRARGLVGRRLLCTEKIVGSNPTGSTLSVLCGCSSVVERLLAKEKVVSSNLITRSVPFIPRAEVAQPVEHSTENARVPSSSLGFGIPKGDRLRAGQRSLEPPVGVRIPVPL